MIVDGGRQVLRAAPRWRLPTLLMWAGADRCVAPAGSAAFATAAPAAVVQSRCFDGLAHEIFNEPEREQVLAHLLGWLAGQTAVGH
jgi:alpha-beta hydrolase superfamily lysophospholipase